MIREGEIPDFEREVGDLKSRGATQIGLLYQATHTQLNV
jgi:hypothetical protein